MDEGTDGGRKSRSRKSRLQNGSVHGRVRAWRASGRKVGGRKCRAPRLKDDHTIPYQISKEVAEQIGTKANK